MKPLADDLLVFVDCNDMTDFVREDLFMPSRDRLAGNDFKESLVESLEKTVGECQALRELRNRRQQERMSAKLKDEQPLAEVLQSLIHNSPNLTTLLQKGQRISAPFNTKVTGSDKKTEFRGEVYPTIFKYKGVEYGTITKLNRPINHRVRLAFETNARDDYFTRAAERGLFDLTWVDAGGTENEVSITGPNLRSGIATVMLDFPGAAQVREEMTFIARVHDSIRKFENPIVVAVGPSVKYKKGGSGERIKPPSEDKGADRERPMEVAPPMIIRVYREQWEDEGFDEHTAMKVKPIGYTDDEKAEVYEFRVNMDNTPIFNESKQKRLDQDRHRLLCEQFLYANVLIGLSLLLDDTTTKKGNLGESETPNEMIEERIERTCRALAPFIPALVSLGTGDLESDDMVEGVEEIS